MVKGIPILPLLCLLAVTVTAGAQDSAKKLVALEQRLREQRATLAQDAFDAGLLRESSVLARAVLDGQPDHAVGKLIAQLKNIPTEEFVRTNKEAAKKGGRSFWKRVASDLRPIATDLVALADAAAMAGEAEFAESVYAKAYTVDPDNRVAYGALKKLDYDTIFNYGVLPGAEKDDARALLKRLGGRFLRKSDLDDELENWADAWGMQTDHYRFVSNAPHPTVFAFAEACEDLYDSWEDWMRANKQPLRKLTRPCTVYLFASSLDYETVLRLQGDEPLDSDEVLGYYAPRTKIGCFYCDDGFYEGDHTLLFETFFHEGAHQLFDLRFKAAWRGLADDTPLHWVEEGTCVYLESLVVAGEGRARKGKLGTILDDDLQIAVEQSTAGKLLPIADFVHQDDTAWDNYEDSYPHAALLAHWLLEADGGKRSKVLFDLLTAERQHGGIRKKTFFDLVGMTPEQVDTALAAHAKHIAKALTVRTYGKPEGPAAGK